jgi:hypothetical protein
VSITYRNGLGHTAAFQVSSIPFATASLAIGTSTPVNVSFINITKFISVRNEGANELRFGFSENGVQATNYISLATSASYAADFKVGDLYLIASGGNTTASVIAGLTSIKKEASWNNWTGSAGVG